MLLHKGLSRNKKGNKLVPRVCWIKKTIFNCKNANYENTRDINKQSKIIRRFKKLFWCESRLLSDQPQGIL